MDLLPYGERALLVELADHLEALALYEDLQHDPITGVVDLVPAAQTLLITFTDSDTCLAAAGPLACRRVQPRSRQESAVVEIPVSYDGEDLVAVAKWAGRSVKDVIGLHHEAEYLVAFIGFAPGFGYLTGLPAVLQMPRRDNPRTRVPAGSVAIADQFSAVYPQPSPGGWQLLGHTSLQMWDVGREQPALLSPGTRVRFTPVTR